MFSVIRRYKDYLSYSYPKYFLDEMNILTDKITFDWING